MRYLIYACPVVGGGCNQPTAQQNKDAYQTFRRTLFYDGDGHNTEDEGGGPPGIVYKWAHPACNEIKNAFPFLDVQFDINGYSSNGPLNKNIENCLATLIYEGRNNSSTKSSKAKRWAQRCQAYCTILNTSAASASNVAVVGSNVGNPNTFGHGRLCSLPTAGSSENIQYTKVRWGGPPHQPVPDDVNGNIYIPLSIYYLAMQGPFAPRKTTQKHGNR